MITQDYVTISPAYGRDYKSRDGVESAFEKGEDFVLESMGFGGGKYCSVRDFAKGVKVALRYHAKRKVTIFKVGLARLPDRLPTTTTLKPSLSEGKDQTALVEVMTKYGIILPQKEWDSWRVPVRVQLGGLTGLESRGRLVATNGILAYLVKEDESLMLIHLENFVPDDVEEGESEFKPRKKRNSKFDGLLASLEKDDVL